MLRRHAKNGAFRYCALAALELASLQSGLAQVIRTETQVVLVDVVASDKKGYVRDLSISDFRVFEDGKEQKLTSISRETDASAMSRRHYVVLLFENASMSGSEQQISRQIAARFVDSTIAAAKPSASSGETAPLTAVMSFASALRVTQTFTEDSQRVKQAIAAMPLISINGSQGDTLAIAKQTADAAVRETIHALDTLVHNLEGVPGRKSLVWFTPGLPVTGDNSAAVDAVINKANRSNIAIYPVTMRPPVFAANTATADQGGTATTGRGGRFPNAASAVSAMRGGPNDTAAVDPATAQANSTAMAAGLSRLASKTGGFVVTQPNDPVSLSKVSAEQGEYYLLGYTPPPSAPGSCHRLRVDVGRKNVDLRSRAEYCIRDNGSLISSSNVEKALEARVQSAGAATSTNSPVANTAIAATQQTSFFYTGSGVARVMVAMEMDPANIAFKKDKNTFQASIEILGLAQKADGSTSARFSDTKKFEFVTQAEVDAFKKQLYHHEAQFDIAAGDYTLAIAFGAGVPASGSGTGGSFGRVTVPLHVEPYGTGDFMMSGLVLGEKLRDANQLDADLDELLIDDRKKLLIDGTELVPLGSNRLRSGVPANVFFEIYEPLLASVATRASAIVAVQMLVVDRTTGAQKVDTGLVRLDLGNKAPAVKNGTSVIPLGFTIPLRTLSAGSYTLEIQAGDSAGKGAKRTVDFEIE